MPLARQARSEGIRTEIYPDSGAKMKKQMSYANAKRIPYVALAGEDEISQNCVTLKDMLSGEQQTVERAKLVGTVLSLLNGKQ